MLISFLVELSQALRMQGLEIVPAQILDCARYILLSDDLSPDASMQESLKPILITKVEEEDAYSKAWRALFTPSSEGKKTQNFFLYNILKKEESPSFSFVKEKESLSQGLDWQPWKKFQNFCQNKNSDSKNSFEQAVMNALAHGQTIEEWEKAMEESLFQNFSKNSDTQELEKTLEQALEFRKEFSQMKRKWNKVMSMSMQSQEEYRSDADRIGEKKSLRPEFIQGYRANVLRWGESSLFMKNMEDMQQQDLNYLQEPIRQMAERLRVRLESRRRKIGGKIDMKKTIRIARKTFGEPVKLVRHCPKRKRPRWVVLADISGSVKYATQLFLTFLSELRNIIDEDLRGFVFVSKMKEITHLLKEKDYHGDIEQIRQNCGIDLRGYSDYGDAFAQFESQAQDAINRTTILLILGDARNNKRNPRLDLLESWCLKTRKVLWLNPEVPEKWDQGDSIMGIYSHALKHVYDISTPGKLIDVMENIVI
ncbi:MAG: VWA domain-containing protein [Candidatus Brocadiae bacterium]|nr:VWA domain-containing protein [Candidatus Brocadiia bacterium]